MAKRKRKSRKGAAMRTRAGARSTQRRSAAARRSIRKAVAARRRKGSRKPARQAISSRRAARSNRAAILAEMKTAGLTAKQAAKKYKISVWTIYGWRKTRAGRPTAPAKRGRPVGSRSSRGALAEMLRPVIQQLVREELARLAGR